MNMVIPLKTGVLKMIKKSLIQKKKTLKKISQMMPKLKIRYLKKKRMSPKMMNLRKQKKLNKKMNKVSLQKKQKQKQKQKQKIRLRKKNNQRKLKILKKKKKEKPIFKILVVSED